MPEESTQSEEKSQREERTHCIKVLLLGKKRWTFLSGGSTNNLKLHASLYTEKDAIAEASVLAANNPELIVEAKVVPFYEKALTKPPLRDRPTLDDALVGGDLSD